MATLPSRLVSFQDFASWTPIGHGIETSVNPDIAWNELVCSWNIDMPSEQQVEIEASPDGSKWYKLGKWSPATTRTSVNEQKDADFKVDTDTLVASSPQHQVKIRIVWNSEQKPDLKLFTACFADRKATSDVTGKPEVYGEILQPPLRTQMSYPGGEKLCSATSTSMLLGYWSKVLDRPILDKDVPEVQTGVNDPGWPGTGNWPFNMAYAGNQPGMRAYVARFWGIGHLEQWIARGVPVACSVAYTLLKGQEKKPNDGHLVVLVGFTKEGDPVFNDPGKNVVRMIYKRADFEKAWAYSGRTVYLVYPKTWSIPENVDRVWAD